MHLVLFASAVLCALVLRPAEARSFGFHHVVETFVGNGDLIGGGNVTGSYRFIADFEGEPLAGLPAGAPVGGVITPVEGGKVIEQFAEYVMPSRRWRLSILAKPAEGKPLSLRAFLKKGDQALTETWTYRLPWENEMREGSRQPGGTSQ